MLSVTANATVIILQIVTTASGGVPAVKGVNLDTWGKIDADCTADITVNGLPAMATSGGNISSLNPKVNTTMKLTLDAQVQLNSKRIENIMNDVELLKIINSCTLKKM